MYPEDRVLVGVMPDPRDLELARAQRWYRVPEASAPRGIHAEYVAFYFTRRFPEELRWAVHFYARRTGHELVRRIDLFPEEPGHPRANDRYYKIQLGELRHRNPPIVSAHWRRITFIQTTWDRFIAAREVNDLYSTDDGFVDRIYHALKRAGIQPDRQIAIVEQGTRYTVDMMIPCQTGAVVISRGEDRPKDALELPEDEADAVNRIQTAIRQKGGPLASRKG
jgi:hypothetical protein